MQEGPWVEYGYMHIFYLHALASYPTGQTHSLALQLPPPLHTLQPQQKKASGTGSPLYHLPTKIGLA